MTVRLLRTDRRLLLTFARYLFLKKYRSLRTNLTQDGIEFLRFIAINYGRSSWVPAAFNDYDQYDYLTWLPDASLDFARQLVLASATSRQLLERADRLLFQQRLGH